MDVRFHQPVYHSEEIEIALREDGARAVVEIEGRATGTAWMGAVDAPAVSHQEHPLSEPRVAASRESLSVGTVLGSLIRPLDVLGSKMSAPLEAETDWGHARPAVLLALANEILVRHVELGPWIHVASEVRNFAAVLHDDPISVRGIVTEQYERKGHEFVVLDVAIFACSHLAEQVRHTAIWRPRSI
jgi:hypothetical protein